LPGGGQQLGETLEEAIRREVREETGLELAAVEFLTTVDLIERDADGRVRFHYTLVDFTAEAADGEPVAGDDAADAAWFEADQLAGLGLWSETLRVVAAARAQRRAAAGA
ncbi:MAG: NUDIX domain-containing protein, partial [Geminicoccaceae bacterium]